MTYELAPAPKFAGMRDWDCARCGRQEVKPVFLRHAGTVASYGSGCAALLLGRPQAARAVRAEAETVQRREDERLEILAERAERFARALDAFHSAPNEDNGDLCSARRTYHAMGGGPVLGLFPAWMAEVVAAGGDLDRNQ